MVEVLNFAAFGSVPGLIPEARGKSTELAPRFSMTDTLREADVFFEVSMMLE